MKILLGSILLLSLASLAPAGVILMQHDFDGDGSAGINGVTPDYLDSSLTGATWTAPDDASGDLGNDGVVGGSMTAWVDIGSLVNDNRGNPDAIYTLTVSTTAGGSWTVLGFLPTGATGLTTNNITAPDNAGVNWMLYRDGAHDFDAYLGQATAGGAEFTDEGSSSGGEESLSVTLDFTAWDGVSDFGTATFRQGSTILGTGAYALDNNQDDIGAIAISAAGSGGSFSSVEFTVVPEPSAFALIAGALVLSLVMQRRRR